MITNVLINESTTDGDKGAIQWDGGVGTVHAAGTWDGASLTLEYKPAEARSDIEPDFAPTDLVLTSSVAVKNFFLGSGQIRVVQAGSGGATSLTAHAVKARV